MTTTQKTTDVTAPDAATGGGRCRDAGNGVTERSRQLRHCQTERTGDCRLQHETDRGCVFDSASQKQLSEAQSKALSARFNTALEASLQAWQQKHHAVIWCRLPWYRGSGYHPGNPAGYCPANENGTMRCRG